MFVLTQRHKHTGVVTLTCVCSQALRDPVAVRVTSRDLKGSRHAVLTEQHIRAVLYNRRQRVIGRGLTANLCPSRWPIFNLDRWTDR